ncbi:MAG: PQQ-binding-like beta-propeller repeat protein [Phycisphaerales bacterium]|nr:PQQ-binding-like beta-propeller repeat protein [Phycisphaerales bacterium]
MLTSKLLSSIALAALLVGTTACAAVHDWPQWRGANQDNISTESGWQTQWPAEGPKHLWEAKVDEGMSSLTVADGRVYTLGFRLKTEGEKEGLETVHCLDAKTGKELWHYTYEMGLLPSMLPVGSTPTVVGGRVYTMGNAADLHCLDARTGKLIWSHNMAKEFGAVNVAYGYTASPLVTDNLVIIPIFTSKPHSPPKNHGGYAVPGGILMAFAADTGKLVWQNSEGTNPWATPALGTIDGQPTLVTYTGKELRGMAPLTGATLWKSDAAQGEKGFCVGTSPVIAGDKIVVQARLNGIFCMLVKNGEVTTLWMRPKSHWFSNVTIYDGCIYAPSREAELDCIDLATGKDLWHSRIGMTGEPADRKGDMGGRHPVSSGSAHMIADGKILMLNRDGFLVCAEINAAGAKILSIAKILDDSGWSYFHTPTLSGGKLYMRNNKGNVVCLDVRK